MCRVLLNKMIAELFGVDRSDVTRSTERRCCGAALEQQEEYVVSKRSIVLADLSC